uniref:Voltage-dependent calcium channel alpha-2/delta subunit conserved region domain-containing protein n=1 Tax=Clastoptera arizonana TaxID=38151 RepID=A0A1B6DYJ0_9HEMI
MFGDTLSFVATRSGLLRWNERTPSGANAPQFSEENRHAMDEVWYKRAVDQHTIEPESFVFSVPFDAGNTGRVLVTATHAVFVENKGHRAPAAVVGIQFQHSVLAQHFINITSTCISGAGCKKTCASEELDCYVLDNNGFIILSEKTEHTGQFFGHADGTIMDSLVQDGIYKKIPVMDYQGACVDSKSFISAGTYYKNPWQTIGWFLQFLMSRILWLLTQSSVWNTNYSFAQEDTEADPMYADYETNNFDQYGTNTGPPPDINRVVPNEDNLPPNIPPPPPAEPPVHQQSGPPYNRSHARPCIKKVDLYILQPSRLNNSGSFNPLKGKLTNCHVTGCERPFSVQKIPHSNLILLVVDTLCPCGSKQLSIAPQEVAPSEHCRVPSSSSMYRRRPNKCISYHPEEIEIKQCGRSCVTQAVTSVLLSCLFIVLQLS